MYKSREYFSCSYLVRQQPCPRVQRVGHLLVLRAQRPLLCGLCLLIELLGLGILALCSKQSFIQHSCGFTEEVRSTTEQHLSPISPFLLPLQCGRLPTQHRPSLLPRNNNNKYVRPQRKVDISCACLSRCWLLCTYMRRGFSSSD